MEQPSQEEGVANDALSQITAVATGEEGVAEDTLSQNTALQQPLDEEGVVEDAKIRVVQNLTKG